MLKLLHNLRKIPTRKGENSNEFRVVLDFRYIEFTDITVTMFLESQFQNDKIKWWRLFKCYNGKDLAGLSRNSIEATKFSQKAI